MNEKAVSAYLAAVESANENPRERGKILQKARQDLMKADNETATEKSPQSPQSWHTYYEEVTDVGFYPQERRLEAIINVKRPYGFAGAYGSGFPGSYEYVAFYISWNLDRDLDDNGEHVCTTYVHVFDAQSFSPPADFLTGGPTTFPINYAVYRDIIPLPTLRPGTVVRVRAILSWWVKPTGPNFVPVWGNVIDRNIKIDPME